MEDRRRRRNQKLEPFAATDAAFRAGSRQSWRREDKYAQQDVYWAKAGFLLESLDGPSLPIHALINITEWRGSAAFC
jgi:hypothetical protein